MEGDDCQAMMLDRHKAVLLDVVTSQLLGELSLGPFGIFISSPFHSPPGHLNALMSCKASELGHLELVPFS